MFSILVSEKGGAERQEVFDRAEISIGRVQSNDLVLPKGNVSKHHARIRQDQASFVLTDLRSTNGTYVNGKKVTGEAVLTDADKVYIGDFVIRLERPAGASLAPPSPESMSGARRDPRASHYPPEQDSSEEGGEVRVPGPPRVPARAGTPAGASSVTPGGMQAALSPLRRGSLVDRLERSWDVTEGSAHRACVMGLVHAVENAVAIGLEVTPAVTEDIARRLREALPSVLEGLPPRVSADELIQEATAELIGLGPVAPLLTDDDVHEVRVLGSDFLVSLQGRRATLNEIAFSSETSLARVVQRLAMLERPAGPLERLIERRLPGGVRMTGLLGGQGGRHALTLRKPFRAGVALEELVRKGTLSRAMATVVMQLGSARSNLLVIGSPDATLYQLIGALASSGGGEERLIVVQGEDELQITSGNVLSIHGLEAAESCRAVARLRPDRWVAPLSRTYVPAVVDAVAYGTDGLVAHMTAPSVRQAALRVAASLMSEQPGLSAQAAYQLVSGSFDLVVEVARLRDGRHRVVRVAELATEGVDIAVRDIFQFVPDRMATGGTVEGSFSPTGHIPRAIEDMALKGASIDTSVFRRAAR